MHKIGHLQEPSDGRKHSNQEARQKLIFFFQRVICTVQSQLEHILKSFTEFHLCIATQNANKEESVFSLCYILFPHSPLH